MNIPNLFIVGAPRCGTTSLYSFLRKVPWVFFPSVKEPGFFAKDLFAERGIKTYEQYPSLYNQAGQKKYYGDATVMYLYSKNAVSQILKSSRDAKIIISIRNPADQYISLYNYLNLYYDLPPIEKALRFRYYGLELIDYSNYPKFIKPYLAKYKKNAKVIIFEEFFNDRRGDDLLNFLNLNYSNLIIPHKKESRIWRANVKKILSASHVKSIFSCMPMKIRPKMIAFVTTMLTKKYFHDNAELRNKLLKRKKKEIEQLSSILKRSLEIWD